MEEIDSLRNEAKDILENELRPLQDKYGYDVVTRNGFIAARVYDQLLIRIGKLLAIYRSEHGL